MSSSIKNDGDVKKFLFDNNDFDKAKVPEADRPAYSENQLNLAREQSHAQGRSEGHAAGLAEAKQQQEETIIAQLAAVAARLDTLVAREESRELQSMTDAVRLAMRALHKLVPAFAEKNALPEIERVILQSLEVRKDEPRIAITVATQHLEPLKARIDAMALEKGYAGKLILIADDNMNQKDCRVEWADGGAERVFERLFARIEGEFTRTVGSLETFTKDETDTSSKGE